LLLNFKLQLRSACLFINGTQVLAMLDEAKRLIDEGRMTPEELDRNLVMNLQVRFARMRERHVFAPCAQDAVLAVCAGGQSVPPPLPQLQSIHHMAAATSGSM
jgi:hypothetical protein